MKITNEEVERKMRLTFIAFIGSLLVLSASKTLYAQDLSCKKEDVFETIRILPGLVKEKAQAVIAEKESPGERLILATLTANAPHGRLRVNYSFYLPSKVQIEYFELPEKGHMQITDHGWDGRVTGLRGGTSKVIYGADFDTHYCYSMLMIYLNWDRATKQKKPVMGSMFGKDI